MQLTPFESGAGGGARRCRATRGTVGNRPRRHGSRRRSRRRLLRLRQRRLAEDDGDSARPLELRRRRGADRADRQAHRRPHRRRRQGERGRPDPTRARSATTTRRSSTRRPSSTRASRRLQPTLAAVAAIKDAGGLARALGATLRADVDVLNNSHFDTDNLFGLWVAQDLSDPTRYSPFLLQGGLGMPDRDYYLDPSPRMADIRKKYQAHVAALLGRRRNRRRRGQGARIFELEHKHRAGARDARRHRGRAEGQQPLDARRASPSAPPGSTGRPSSPPPGSTSRTRFVVWQPKALVGIAALVAQRAACDAGRTISRSTRSSATRGVLPKTFDDEDFAFHGTVLNGTPQAARSLEARRRRHRRRARRGGRQALRRQVLPAVGEGARRGDGEEPARRVRAAHRQADLDGAGDEGQGQGQARRAQGRRRLSRQVARLLGARGRARRRARQRRARVAVRVPPQPRASSGSRSTAASG